MTKKSPTIGLNRDFGFIPMLTPERLYFTSVKPDPSRGGHYDVTIHCWGRPAVDPSMGGKYTNCTMADAMTLGRVNIGPDGVIGSTVTQGPDAVGDAIAEEVAGAAEAVRARIQILADILRRHSDEIEAGLIGEKLAGCVPGWRSTVFCDHAPGSRQIRQAWVGLGLREGTAWPSSEDARAGLLRDARDNMIPDEIRHEKPYGSGADAGEILPPQASPAVDTAPAVFDPDGMTHRELVDLAAAGAQSATILAANERLLREMDNLEKAVVAAHVARDEAVKRADMLTPDATAVAYEGDTCTVLGVTLPRVSGDHGPTPTPGYDLKAWRAQMKITDLTAKANAAQVAKAIFDGDSVRLVGPPSVGKTSGIREVCALTGAKFFLVPCGEGATDLSLIAERTIAADRSMQWVDGHVTKAVRWAIDHPDVLVVCVLDEVDHLPAEVQSLMHSVLEGGELVVNPSETLLVPPNMRFTCTANTSGAGDMTGRHQAAKVSDTAFTSRWNATFTVTYLPKAAEIKVLVAAGCSPDDAKAAVEAAKDTRTEGASVSQPIVLRQLLAFARGCGRGEDVQFSWCWRVLASMPEHDRPAMREITKLKFGW